MSAYEIDATHDPVLDCWVEGANDHPDFPVQNLPLGIFAPTGEHPRAGTRIGEYILDLRAIASLGLVDADLRRALNGDTLNPLFALGQPRRRALRHALCALLCDLRRRDMLAPHLRAADGCVMHLPARIGDYTDFYVGIHHATNVGKQFRPDQPLLPNYKYVPIGYHGRASSVRVSGAPVIRPSGQRKPPDADAPDFGPTARLDHELELGVWIGPGNAAGHPIPIHEAADHVAGFCLLNDWSARDIQAWEYQPLGPFLSKSFLTSVSPWVVTAEALAPFRTAQAPRPEGDPAPLPYLSDPRDQASGALGLTIEAYIRTAAMRAAGAGPHRLSHGSATAMYWTVAQMVAHHSVNGCDLRPGDLLGTGTLSGPAADSAGSMLELSQGGRTPIPLPGGESRSFLEDGDELILSAFAQAPGYRRIGLGVCTGLVEPAR
jgi:fumarylacetoacetase